LSIQFQIAVRSAKTADGGESAPISVLEMAGLFTR